MYTVRKDGGMIVIVNWKGEVVYSVDSEAIIVYDEVGTRMTAKVSMLTPEKLLLALVNSVKLPF